MLAAATIFTSSLLAGENDSGSRAPLSREPGDPRIGRIRRKTRSRTSDRLEPRPSSSRYSADSHPLAPHNLTARGYHTFSCFDEPFHVPKRYSLVRPLGYGAYGCVALAQREDGEYVACVFTDQYQESDACIRT